MFVREQESILDHRGGVILTEKELLELLNEHRAEAERLEKLHNYYVGKHPILERQAKSANLPNNQVMINHAKYITDICTGYMVGNPVSYTGEDMAALQAVFKSANIHSHDTSLGKSASVFGKSYELVYLTPTGQPAFTVIDPRQAFLVAADDVAQTPLLGVRYYTLNKKTKVFLYSAHEVVQYMQEGASLLLQSREPNLFGQIPLVEYINNEEATADFEDVLSLIDAYNLLASDRVNDKEQFVHCLLVLTNCNIDSQAYEKVREWGVMALAGDGRAEYLTKTLNEADTEVLRGALVEDIHKISMVPALTDQHFAGNVSGLAMEYKLLGFEQKIKIKERFFIRGLMQRIALVGRLLELQGLASPKNVEVVFTRSMPMDTMEVAQMINLLDGVVSRETLLAQLPFINNVAAELERVKGHNTLDNQREELGNDAI